MINYLNQQLKFKNRSPPSPDYSKTPIMEHIFIMTVVFFLNIGQSGVLIQILLFPDHGDEIVQVGLGV
jgi:hypothetical protein